MRLNNPISLKNGVFALMLRFSVLAGFGCISSTAHSQNIGNWTFNNTLIGTPGVYNTVSVADFSGAVPIHAFNGGTEYFGENGWPSGAINTASFLEFSLTPLAGYQLDISSIVLRLRRSNTGSPAGAGPTSWSLRSSLDGFTADIASGSMTHTYANYTVAPGSGFLQLYSTVTFRLYGYTASVNPGGSSRLVADNITVTGLGYLLPIKQIGLKAFATGQKVTVSYDVYDTEKNSEYLIERSTDGMRFNTIFQREENENAAEKHYTWDEPIAIVPVLYYRIARIDTRGQRSYSAVAIVKANVNNPPLTSFISENRLHISGICAAGAYALKLYNISGQLLEKHMMNASTGYSSFTFSLKEGLPAMIIIQLTDSRGYTYSVLLPHK